MEASANAPKIFYEFLFGDEEFLQRPYFPQNFYRIQLLPEYLPISQKDSTGKIVPIFEDGFILTSLRAISPLNEPLSYSLIGKEERSPFQILTETGKNRF